MDTSRGSLLLAAITSLLLSSCPNISFGQQHSHFQSPPQAILGLADLDVNLLHPMILGCELPGVPIDLVTSRGVLPMEAGERIRLSYGSQSILLRQFHELRGHVRITDGLTALRFARLLSSPETWFLWDRAEAAVEIVEARDALTLPNFGLNEQPLFLHSPWILEKGTSKNGIQYALWRYGPRTHRMELVRFSMQRGNDREKVLRTMNPPDLTLLGNGFMGVLTRSAYLKGGFSPAAVVPVARGFQIKRWLFVKKHSARKKQERIQQVQEFVGSDGEYRSAVIKTVLMPPWSLFGTRFLFPMFE